MLGRLVLRSRRTALLVLLLGAVGVAAAVLPAPPEGVASSSATGLSSAVESARAEQLRTSLPDAGRSAGLIVVDRVDGGRLSEQDLGAVAAATRALADLAVGGQVPPPAPAPDGTVVLVPVPLPEAPGAGAGEQESAQRVDDLRERLRAALPAGLRGQVTGGPAFAADLSRVFDGADVRLLVATSLVVALLLLVTYRSLLLVVVPLAAVAATEQATLALIAQVLPRLDLPDNGQATGIASVLVFGAATNYALLLIARYREQLRVEPALLVAMRTALSRTTEPILASGGSVLLALAVLLLASTESLRAVAVACILGIALALLTGLLVLPAALVLFGRAAFWPLVPRVGDRATEGRFWGRLGEVVLRAPARTLAVSVVVLAVAAGGLFGLRTGLSQNDAFLDPPESVTAAQRLAEALPAGSADPLTVLAPTADVEAAAQVASGVVGVASATPGRSSGVLAEVSVVLTSSPGTAGARESVLALRAALDQVGDGSALVGGTAAERVDLADAEDRDRRLIIPLVLLLVGLVLVVLLRSLVAPVLLVATVVLTFASSLGASWLLFDRVLGFPAVDGGVVVLAFLFLVALGVDYNIFLATRAREESAGRGTREGMLVALRVTGGVITSAGLLLAAVFAVLGVLPVLVLTQIGVIVCVGVLLDTLLVRTVVVPALAFLFGDRFWWPSHPTPRRPREPERELAAAR